MASGAAVPVGRGYPEFVAQGGDWGNAVTEQMALLRPAGLLGIHTNMPATVPPGIRARIRRRPAAWEQPETFSAEIRATFRSLRRPSPVIHGAGS